MTDDAPCRLLDWDSKFFGRRIARAQANRLTQESLRQIKSWCTAERIDCLYFLAHSADAETVKLAEEARFHLVDVRVTLGHDLAESASSHGSANVRPFQPADLPGLKAIARLSHRDSRFYYDQNFPDSLCDSLYETWIENSTQGYAQAVLVGEHQSRAAGYITCHLTGSAGQIGLFAVAQEAQGHGLGQQLVLAALGWFKRQGVSEVTVVTQGRNVRGERLYQRCGFSTRSVELWYHYWPGLRASGGA
jgi:dTDP-4-amino-4,6-dideoxy-D-galactose acyltransferase